MTTPLGPEQPGYGQPGYGQPGYGPPPPGWGPPQRGTNTLAIVALVAIFVFTPAAFVLGLIARKQIRETGEQGDGMALAAVIVGAISIVFTVLLIVFVVLAVASSGY
jgi:hypothetical protein